MNCFSVPILQMITWLANLFCVMRCLIIAKKWISISNIYIYARSINWDGTIAWLWMKHLRLNVEVLMNFFSKKGKRRWEEVSLENIMKKQVTIFLVVVLQSVSLVPFPLTWSCQKATKDNSSSIRDCFIEKRRC